MKTIITIALLAMIFIDEGLAQSLQKGKINGEVLDESKKPMQFATVMLLNIKDSSLVKGEITDASGKYKFENIAQGKYISAFTLLGYKKLYSSPITLDVDHLNITVPSVEMQMETKSLSEVIVVGQKPFIEQQIDKTVVNVENSIVASGGNAMEVLERAPGVMIDKDDRISLRGKQGVIIMIDGKPTNLSAGDVANMLRNMPSNGIEKIELITNPSAKYDAAGNAGIINIKLKKNSNAGFNGSANIGAGYGKFEKYNGGINLNYRKGKINVFGNYNYSYNKRFNSNQLLRTIGEGDQVTYFDQFNYRPMEFINHSYKGGIDYSINKNHTIGFMMNGFLTDGFFDVKNDTKILNDRYEVDSSLMMVNKIDNRWKSMAYNLNYKATLDTLGRELSMDLDYSKFNGQSNDNLSTDYFGRGGEKENKSLILRSDIPTEVDIKSAKIDYAHPLSKTSKVEAGLKSSYVTTDNNVKFEGFNEGQWSLDATRTNHFQYTENINAAYINFNTKFKGFGIQLGLRGENTTSKGYSVTLDSSVKRNYFQLFPSAFVTQKISEKHQLGYSYSRRINRPSYQDLNPFIYFLDPYAYFQGNPYLRPEFTNSFQVSHTYKGAFITSLGYSSTNNVITQVTEQNDSTKVTKATMFNLDSYNNFNLGLSAPLPVTKWWTTNNNLNIYYKEYKSNYLGGNLNSNQFSWTFNTSHNLKLPNDFGAEINGMYHSPNIEGIIKMKSMYVLSLGVQKNFMNKKANLKLNVNDIFNVMRFRGSINYQNMDIKIRGRWESRQARLTFTYRFGNNDIKPARRRTTGAEDLQNRVKMGGN